MLKEKIAIIGLGYVGMPLAAAFSEHFEVIGYDLNQSRIDELKNGFDKTLELSPKQMQNALKQGIKFTDDIYDLKECTFFIISVPTPIDKNKRPDLSCLQSASLSVAKVLKKGDIVVFESTVYPGVSEEFCAPLLQSCGLKFGIDFEIGYSPERINPGDKEHTVSKIKKIVSASSKGALERVSKVYAQIIKAGIYEASSIKVAEAAKVIENTQRDINIAFINELLMIFDKMEINTQEVLKAASTKWNFLNFTPGLVGGHCIGVDPYYLTHKAAEIGHHAELILASRRINDNMGIYHANVVIKKMIKHNLKIKGAKVLILGLTFKENCPDIRNTRVIDLYNELRDFGCELSVNDPWANENEVKKFYNINFQNEKICEQRLKDYDCVILAVAHDEFKKLDFSGVLTHFIKYLE